MAHHTSPVAHTAVYAGTFDPPTLGHLWMIEQGAQLFPSLIVAIGRNAVKSPTFSDDDRMSMLAAATAHLPNVRVCIFDSQYLVRFAARCGAGYILRGVRNTTDYHYEHTLRQINHDLAPHIHTVFLMPPRELAEVSSSTIKALIGPQGWSEVVKKLVPAQVHAALLAKYTPKARQSPKRKRK